MLKFAIIGSLNENTQDLLDQARKNGHTANVFKLDEITFKTLNEKLKAICGDFDICDFDVVIFRGYSEHIYEAKLLAEMLIDKGKIVIEKSLARDYVRGKMFQAKYLLEKNINHPKTFQAIGPEKWQNILKDIDFPIMAKPIMGRKGRGIKKLENFKEALDFFLLNIDGYLVQQYFPIKSDFRILVIGGKVIGGFERFINEGEYKSNIAGTRAEKILVSPEMEKVAISAARAMGYEIAGVDLFEYEGRIYVIEVNVSPQWEKFKLVTGINPAEHIIKYAEEKKLINK